MEMQHLTTAFSMGCFTQTSGRERVRWGTHELSQLLERLLALKSLADGMAEGMVLRQPGA